MLSSHPRRRVDCAPTAAEHARTFLAAATGLFLGDPGEVVEVARHAMTTDGTLLLAAAPLRDVVGLRGHDGPAPVRVGVVDVAPLPLADRVRGRVALVGEVRVVRGQVPEDVAEHLLVDGDGEVLRISPRRVAVSGRLVGPSRRGITVDIEDYRLAAPDPLVGIEPDWLDHLAGAHADVLEALAVSVAGARHRDEARVARAVALDRHGLVLRIGAVDVRLTFRAPVTCGCDLTEAFADLVDRLAPGVGWGCDG